MTDDALRIYPSATPCPKCGGPLNATVHVDEVEVAVDRPDAITVCAWCCTVLWLDEATGALKLPAPLEAYVLELDDNVQRVVAVARAARARHDASRSGTN